MTTSTRAETMGFGSTHPTARRAALRATAFVAALSTSLALAAFTAVPAAAAPSTIAAVQGDGTSTPLNGQTVTVEGVVTVDQRTGGYNGVYIQSLAPDENPATSEGVFVFLGSRSSSTTLAIGDRVEVTGTAGEYFGLTQISASSGSASVTVLESGVDLPAPAPLAENASTAERESLEGMLVAPEGDWLVSSSHQLFNFGTLWLSPGELAVTSTELFDAGSAEQLDLAAQNRASRLLLDDGFSIQISNSAHPGTQPYFTTDEVVRNGDAVTFPEAGMVLSYGFDDWRLHPQLPASSTQNDPGVGFESRNARPAEAPEVGGELTVAAYNVFNYFTTLTSQNSQARGATSAALFEIQQSKIVAAINGLDADVVGLQEIENSVKLGEEPDEAIASLVDALNADAGAGTWDYIPTPAVLNDPAIVDVITNAIIFKPESVTPVGESFTEVDEAVWGNAREPIAQTFAVDGIEFTAIVNHFKSKSSGVDAGDGQGASNADRVLQAEALADLVAGIEGEAGDRVVLLGDFNAYSEEDPVQVFTEAGYVDLVAEEAPGEYTYTFDGQLGSLDHALASPGFAELVTGVGVWGINAPEWSDRGYSFGATEAGTVFRSSDHDPILVGLATTPPPVEIEIVGINDFHGRLEAAAPAAGAAVLGGLVRAVEASNPNTLFVSAGDSLGASTFTSFIQDDQPTIDALNEIGLDVSALGNHEFDRGRSDVDDRIIPASDFPWLAANLYEAGTDDPAYQEYEVIEIDGVRVGFIGAMTEFLPELVSPAGIASLDVGEVVPAVERVSTQLRDGDESNGEADVLVLLVHEGAETAAAAAVTDDSAFGEIVNGLLGDVDAIFSGHTHVRYAHEVPVPGSDDPLIVLQGGQYGEGYAQLSLTVDPATGDLLEIAGLAAPLVGAASPDSAVAQIVADAVAEAAVAGAVRLGDITADIRRAVQPDGSENRGGESTLGNLVADAQLWATSDLGTEVALMNPGGLRADLVFASSGPNDPAGNLTYREAATVQPFANTLVTLELTGDQLRQVLEQQWQPAGSSRPFLKLGVSSTLTYSYDPSAPQGERITGMLLQGQPVSDEQVIRIVTNSFLASGGDNFGVLAQGTNRADSGRIDLQAFVDYVAEFTPISPDAAQRSVGATLSDADADGFSAGDTVTLTLSSLLFSNAGDRDTEVTVSLGGEQLASAPIDATIVAGTDEVGRATVEFTIPDGVSGPQQLLVEVADNGTALSVPIEIVEQLEAIEVERAPRVLGGTVVGLEVRTDGGRFSVGGERNSNVERSYQWLRDGEPIEGATAATYRLTAADAGTRISVAVTANAEGYAPTTATSAERAVRATPSLTIGWADRLLAPRGGSTTYTVQVVAAGVEPVGEVVVRNGNTVVGTIVLEPGDNGRGELRVTGLRRGVNLLTATYEGGGGVEGSRTLLPSPVLAL